ncbi:hypothetical protein DAMA08_003240 [Martiniozyma asiatica (nom. inval.)]|nr:hypothetical protein DAMA08_003240 [Martiniozyma asiatica]
MASYLPSAINSLIKRWTDKRKWSASKDNRPFLVYRELDKAKDPQTKPAPTLAPALKPDKKKIENYTSSFDSDANAPSKKRHYFYLLIDDV